MPRSARSSCLALAAFFALLPGAAQAQDIDALLQQAKDLERGGACERAYIIYQQVQGRAPGLPDATQAARISAMAGTMLRKLQSCYERCQPSDSDKAVFERGRYYGGQGQTKRARFMVKRLLVGKDTKCQFWREVKAFYQTLPAGGRGGVEIEDPCAMDEELSAEMTSTREQLDVARDYLNEFSEVKPAEILKRINDVLGLHRDIDSLREKVYGFREEMVNCDEVYRQLQLDTSGLKEVYDGTTTLIFDAYAAQVAAMEKKVKGFRWRYKKTKKERDEARQKLEDLEREYAELADFTEEIFGDFFDLVGLEVTPPTAGAEGTTVQIPFNELDAILADQRRSLEALAQRYPEYLSSAAGQETIKRRRLVLEKMKKLLDKFQARGYRGVAGFEKTKFELQANLALLNRVEEVARTAQAGADGGTVRAASVGEEPAQTDGSSYSAGALAVAAVAAAAIGALAALLAGRRKQY